MPIGILELTIVIFLASIFSLILNKLKQPLILAYLLTGLIIGFLGYNNLIEKDFLKVFSNLGVMFLLFLVGLEINYKALSIVGRTSVIVGVAQVIFTSLFGYFINRFLGFDFISSLYIAVALTFSSTVIIVKLLSDKKELNSLYGRISLGFLLVQDLIAIFALIILNSLVDFQGDFSFWKLILMLVAGFGLFFLMWFLSRNFLPRFFDYIARSEELLFLISLCWLFLVAFLVKKIGFSIEIAGFLAGVALSNSLEKYQIASRFNSLRDFFILIFFVILGSSIVFSDLSNVLWPIIVLSFFVLIGNPLIVLIIMGLLGYKRRTSFFAGVTVAQISEFSLILIALGNNLGHVSKEVVALVSMVGLITIGLSAYLIIYAESIYRKINKILKIFEKKNLQEIEIKEDEDYQRPIVLIGAHRTGENIAFNLKKEDLLIIDYDPEVVKKLKRKGYLVLYGDIRDKEIFEIAKIPFARLLISTSPDLEDNLTILEELKKYQIKPKVVLRAENEKEARILYQHGADYVLLPNFTAGQYFAKTITLSQNFKILDELRKNDLLFLNKE